MRGLYIIEEYASTVIRTSKLVSEKVGLIVYTPEFLSYSCLPLYFA